ncbi:MAG: DUF166 family protein [Candidatus Heimdallarchaeota archaeon]
MEKKEKLTVGVVSDGKYGDRAFENIKKKFETKWILVPEIPSNIMLDDELDLNIPECDLYISYVRHPDIITQLVELQKPVILGVLPGIGLYLQARKVNPNVIYAPTMCSLENNTGISEVDLFTTYFGRPIYHFSIDNSGVINRIDIERSSLCGSSKAGADFLLNKEFEENNLQNFALNVCYECRAPRFGHTCDKEVAGIIHLVSIFNGISLESFNKLTNNLKSFIKNIRREYERRNKDSTLILEEVIQ